jgi:hypothetical protein
LRIIIVLVCAWTAAGCGVKLGYNNLDRLVRWSVDDYMALDPLQEAYFRTQLDTLLYWHRTSELPVYAREIRKLDAALADGATVEELFVFRAEVETWWQRILETSLPLATQLMYSATDAQLDRFALQFEKDVVKYTKPYTKLSPAERRQRWARDFRDYFEYLTGNLSNEQKQLIEQRSAQLVIDELSWADYRRRYGAALVALVRQRDSFVEFSHAFRDMTFSRERWYGEEYTAALAANQELYRDISIAILNSLTPDQRRQLSKNLLNVAKDFDELSRDAPAIVPADSCLISC